LGISVLACRRSKLQWSKGSKPVVQIAWMIQRDHLYAWRGTHGRNQRRPIIISVVHHWSTFLDGEGIEVAMFRGDFIPDRGRKVIIDAHGLGHRRIVCMVIMLRGDGEFNALS